MRETINKIKLKSIDNDAAELLFNKILGVIKQAEDDLMLDYDINAFEKATAKIIGIIDGLLTTGFTGKSINALNDKSNG